MRWPLADAPKAQGALFNEPIFEREPGRGEFRGLEFLHVRARRIINEVPGEPRFGFRFTINAYRGCSHACSYCFARPTHAYLDLGIDEDFERKLVVKVNAVERVRAELDPRRWGGDLIAMGTNTDPYQRCEGKYRLTQGIVEALIEFANPFSILTKSTLILRDLDLLVEAVKRTDVSVALSIGTLDEEVWRTTEPGTPHPRQRMRAVERLNAAGVPCGVFVAPILPGLSDRPDQIESVVRAARNAGAASISSVLLHLRPGVKEVFLDHLGATHPQLMPRYRRLYPGRRAYAPKAEQQRVADIVRQFSDRPAHHRRETPVRVRRPSPPDQLSLL
ncbi:MAG: radical SAM protein [Acidimicrobiales bacterium]